MGRMATDALTAVAEELYALVPEEFTAARNSRAKAAKADDAELARGIGALRRPSPAAWIVNRLAREQPDGLDELLDLGDALREAQAAGDGRALTRLGSERRRLVSALLGQASASADAADRPTSRAVLDEVEQTLVAGTVDAAAGEAVRTGRLIRSLQAVGLDEVDLDGAVAGAASAAPSPKRPPASPAAAASSPESEAPDDAAAEADAAARGARERAETALREAERVADEAQQALASAEDALTDAERLADELRAERQELEARLRALRAEITDAERAEREAERTRAKAATAADRADDAVDAARRALYELD